MPETWRDMIRRSTLPLSLCNAIESAVDSEHAQIKQVLLRFGAADLALDALDEMPEDPDDDFVTAHIRSYNEVKRIARILCVIGGLRPEEKPDGS